MACKGDHDFVPFATMVRSILLFIMLSVSSAFADEVAAPLFADHAPIKAVLRAPLSDVYKMRRQDKQLYLEGQWIQVDRGGERITLDIKVKLRGNFRRKECYWPPLKLNFKKKQANKTMMLVGQDKLKLVVPCKNSDDYEQYVVSEYLIYRAYNLLTDKSFNVRPVELNLIDTTGKYDPKVVFAFLIEDEDALAERLSVERVTRKTIRSSLLHDPTQAVFDLFQLMMGNTDWSVTVGETDKDCCHNATIVRTPRSEGNFYAIPFDFDFSGAVNARYAIVGGSLANKLTSVRQRHYWGLCRDRAQLDAGIEHINARREAIYDLYRNAVALDEKRRKKTLRYFDSFYEMINNPPKVKRLIVGRCR